MKDKQPFSRWVTCVGEITLGKGITCTKAMRHESADCLVHGEQFRRGRKQEVLCRRGERGKQSLPMESLLL